MSSNSVRIIEFKSYITIYILILLIPKLQSLDISSLQFNSTELECILID